MTYGLAGPRRRAQAGRLLSLDEARRTPLLQEPYSRLGRNLARTGIPSGMDVGKPPKRLTSVPAGGPFFVTTKHAPGHRARGALSAAPVPTRAGCPARTATHREIGRA